MNFLYFWEIVSVRLVYQGIREIDEFFFFIRADVWNCENVLHRHLCLISQTISLNFTDALGKKNLLYCVPYIYRMFRNVWAKVWISLLGLAPKKKVLTIFFHMIPSHLQLFGVTHFRISIRNSVNIFRTTFYVTVKF